VPSSFIPTGVIIMLRTLSLATVLAAALALPAMAEDAKTPAPAAKTPAAAMDIVPAQKGASSLSLTAAEAKAWIGKPVYSSDGTKLGEVAEFQRGDENRVTGLHANVGGFMGLGEHAINLTPAQFKLQTDRIVLDLTAAQVKALPAIVKK
jgi:hypothetical protein